MDDMNKYLSSLGQSQEAADQVQSENSSLQSKTDSFNSKLREVHSQTEGVTMPAALGILAKGASKVTTGALKRAGVTDETISDYQAGGFTGALRGSASRRLGNTDEINQQIDDITQRGAARVASNNIPDAATDNSETGLTDSESAQLDDLAAQSKTALSNTIAPAPEAVASEAAESTVPTTLGADTGATMATSTAAKAATTAGTTTEETLAGTTTGSLADDWNPVGIATTIGLGLATLFAGIFGHKKEQAVRHIQSMGVNPSTQFGV